MSYVVPTRIQAWLQLLALRYAKSEPALSEILNGSKVVVVEGIEHDNLDGGQDGHDIIIFCPMKLLAEINSDLVSRFQDILRENLAAESRSIRGEYIASVHLQVAVSNEELDKAVPIAATPTINPETLSIWKPGYFRVFISHRDRHKVKARELAQLLEDYGCSCFVAHETIPANEEWQKTIANGLRTMEVMLVFLTDDFSDSLWTMQEVGWALGSDIPTVALKLERKDPPGFISHLQALRGNLENLSASVNELFRLMLGVSSEKDRVYSTLITSFIESSDFIDAKLRFDIMSNIVDKLTERDVERIQEAFKTNSQLHNSIYLCNKYSRMTNFLNRATGRRYHIDEREISLVS